MYRPTHFREEDPAVIRAFMEENSFVTLIGATADGKPVATQVPVVIEDREGQLLLRCHVARKSDHCAALEANPQVLALFAGPHCPVRASWYTTNPLVGGTWNYISVQAEGSVTFGTEDDLRSLLRVLQRQVEGSADSPSDFDRLSEEYLQAMFRGIVPLEIAVTEVRAAFKLSQNRDEESWASIVRHLRERGGASATIAEAMVSQRDRSRA